MIKKLTINSLHRGTPHVQVHMEARPDNDVDRLLTAQRIEKAIEVLTEIAEDIRSNADNINYEVNKAAKRSPVAEGIAEQAKPEKKSIWQQSVLFRPLIEGFLSRL